VQNDERPDVRLWRDRHRWWGRLSPAWPVKRRRGSFVKFTRDGYFNLRAVQVPWPARAWQKLCRNRPSLQCINERLATLQEFARRKPFPTGRLEKRPQATGKQRRLSFVCSHRKFLRESLWLRGNPCAFGADAVRGPNLVSSTMIFDCCTLRIPHRKQIKIVQAASTAPAITGPTMT
jgi:hypothetical protein